MSYPKWLTRAAPATTIEAFVMHSETLYFISGLNLYRLDSWCEEPDYVMLATTTWMHAIPALPPAYTNDDGSPNWAMCSAQGLIWITASKELYTYDPVADILGGPYAPPTAEASQAFYDVAEYNNEIHILERFSSAGGRVRLLKFSGVALVAVYQYPNPAASAFGSLEVFQGKLYFPASHRLMSWNGLAAVTEHTFTTNHSVGAMYNLNDTILYVGTGGYNWGTFTPARVHSWDGAAMNFIVTILVESHESNTGFPRVFAYRNPNELYVFLYYRVWVGALFARRVYLVDLAGATSTTNDIEPVYIRDRGLIYNPHADTVWAGPLRTKVWTFHPCGVARTYFFLA